MATYRITYKTKCGKTNVVVENGNYYEEALSKSRLNVEIKHLPMTVMCAEVKIDGNWCLVYREAHI